MNRDDALIEAEELLTKMDDPNLRVYDATILFNIGLSEAEAAKMPTAYEQYLGGHIPGAAFFDHQVFSDSSSDYPYIMISEPELAAQIGGIGIAEDSEVVFYASGMLPCATRAWWILRYAGHNNVRVLNGGLTAWQQVGGKITTEARVYEASKFKGRLRPQMFVGKEEVMAAMSDEGVYTVNTLDLSSHEQGHIVGSACLPCGSLMQGYDSFLSSDEIAPLLKAESLNKRIITYCGGGIAATVNAMAHLFAGNENVSVYDGSMAEWVGEGLPTLNGNML